MGLIRAWAVLAVAFALAACGVDGAPRAPTATGEPVVTVADDADVGTLGGM